MEPNVAAREEKKNNERRKRRKKDTDMKNDYDGRNFRS
jgi:hypothetical protein